MTQDFFLVMRNFFFLLMLLPSFDSCTYGPFSWRCGAAPYGIRSGEVAISFVFPKIFVKGLCLLGFVDERKVSFRFWI